MVFSENCSVRMRINIREKHSSASVAAMVKGLPQRFSNIPIDFLEAVKRLHDYNFPYFYQHLSYDYGGHMFVPRDLPQIKFFKGERKNKENGRKARMDSLTKTLEFVARW